VAVHTEISMTKKKIAATPMKKTARETEADKGVTNLVTLAQGLHDAGEDFAHSVSLAIAGIAVGVDAETVQGTLVMALAGYRSHVATLAAA
jgi:hypothetical protein